VGNRTLVIDTVTPACSVALFEGENLVDHDYREIGRGHAEKIVPMVAALPDKGRAHHILVNCGPGSFTGVRIGMSVASALGLAWNASLAGYQSLHLIAVQALAQLPKKSPVFVAMQGGHGEFFTQNFNSIGVAKDDLLSLPSEQAIERADASILAGSAVESISSGVKAFDQSFLLLPNASMALQINNKNRQLPLTPVYGREPDAVPAKQTY